MPPDNATKIYSAVYSNVPVFEAIINNVAVMRRRSDSYMNATQILKVAGIEKGKRTKILEREVLTGVHEKVQGGYGKYQGTWIPIEKSRELAERYNVLDCLKVIMDFNSDALGQGDDFEELPTKEQALAAQRGTTSAKPEPRQRRHNNNNNNNTSPRLPASPHHTVSSPSASSGSHPAVSRTRQSEEPGRKRPKRESPSPPEADPSSSEQHRNVLMAIFLSDDPNHIPDILKDTSSPDFSIDLVIDEQGSTALHWAAALARNTIAQLLVSKGANLRCVNFAGETPLMRSVMVTNSYDNNSFPQLLQLLASTLDCTDNKHRTVLHHAALTAGIQGRAAAATYYMQHILRIPPSDSHLIDVQDNYGDTALNIAARLGASDMVHLLTMAGGSTTTENHTGLASADYLQPPLDTDSVNQMPEQSGSKRPFGQSQRGQEIIATVQKIVDALDDEFADKLNQCDLELQQIQEELIATTQHLEDSRKLLEERQGQSQHYIEVQQQVRNLQSALQAGWEELGRKETGDVENEPPLDSLFSVPESESNDPATTQKEILRLNALIEAYRINEMDLKTNVQELQARSMEKELQCKRLIAACCNLPIDKIEELVEPLMLAIESDPPDLDLARVIGFMEKIRRQGTFTSAYGNVLSTASDIPSSPGHGHTPDIVLEDANRPDTNDTTHTPNAATPVS